MSLYEREGQATSSFQTLRINSSKSAFIERRLRNSELAKMKQKMLMKVQKMNCCNKCRTKAMKIVSTAPGVISVAIEGSDRDQVVVIGEEVDCTTLTSLLRKKVGHARLLSVEQVKDDTEEELALADQETTSAACSCYRDYIPYTQICAPNPVLYAFHEDPNPCSIL